MKTEREKVGGAAAGTSSASIQLASAPGKRSLAEQLPDAAVQRMTGPVQRKASPVQRSASTDDPLLFAVQRRETGPATNAEIHDAAARGVETPTSAMPHGDAIQRSFGKHDISGVQAHVGGAAKESCAEMGASAFASGNHVVFGGQPDLHTAAHEAAHVVQQARGVSLYGGVGQEGDAYEQHADAVADKVVRGESAEGLLDQTPGGGGGGGVQRMKLPAGDQTDYPRFKTLVQDRIPKCANDSRLVAALNKAGTNSGATKRNIAADLAWGAGPDLKVTTLSGAVGEFSPGIGSKELRVHKPAVKAFQDEADASRLPGHELYLEDTILHEYTHYLDDQDGTDRAGEEGEEFEGDTYGKVIGGVQDALDNVLKGEFGPGTWNVKVESKEAAYKQRFIVTGAKSGEGSYDGTVGNSATVTADPGTKWTLKVQHDDGKTGWKDSTIHKVKEGTDNFLVRSEDATDRDMNDVCIRVKK